MNRIVLSRLLARSKISRSFASDPPEYIELKSGPLTEMKLGWLKIAGRDFPSKVLPEPEGPCKRTPTKDLKKFKYMLTLDSKYSRSWDKVFKVLRPLPNR